MPGIEVLVEDKQGTDECPDRTSGLHRADNRDRQVLEGDKRKDPTAEDNGGFEEREQVRLKIHLGDKERGVKKQLWTKTRENQRDRQNKRREADTEREDINDTVVTQGDLLADVVKAQTERGYEGEESPHGRLFMISNL